MLVALHHAASGLGPAATAAWIAAGASLLTLLGSAGMQAFGIRRVSKDTNANVRQQLAEERVRSLNERFATAADRLGADQPAVRLAGVYAMAGLADDWQESRQTCVDVLCAYVRMPYEPDPGEAAPAAERLAFRASQQVRHTAIRVIADHLRPGAATPWQGLRFDFRGARFDGGDFLHVEFSDGEVIFSRAEFADGDFHFSGAEFSGSTVYFQESQFSGGTVSFSYAKFSGGQVDFLNAEFSGADVYFFNAEFSGGQVSFPSSYFSGGQVYFDDAKFSGGQVDFGDVRTWSKPPSFDFTGAPPPGVTMPPDPLVESAAD